MSNILPTIPPCFLRNVGKRGKPTIAHKDPTTIRKLMLAVFLDEKLTDADHAARHGVSVATVRKYTSWLKWNRRHAGMDVVSRNTKAIMGKVSRRGVKSAVAAIRAKANGKAITYNVSINEEMAYSGA